MGARCFSNRWAPGTVTLSATGARATIHQRTVSTTATTTSARSISKCTAKIYTTRHSSVSFKNGTIFCNRYGETDLLHSRDPQQRERVNGCGVDGAVVGDDHRHDDV